MLEALFLGVLQGITEFFPISSTAHLILVPKAFGWTGLVNSLSFDVALHAGTLLSLIVCFYRDIADMFKKKRMLLLLIAVGTVPAGLAGLLFEDYVSGPLRSPGLIAFMLVLFGIVMYTSDKFKRSKRVEGMGVLDAVFVGVGQALALVPGVSRSGVTIAAGQMRGVKREEAARFSFLLSMPVIGGATLLEGRGLLDGAGDGELAVVATGFLSAFAAGVIAIKFLLKYLKRHSLNAFVIYRFVLAGIIAGWLWLGG